MFTYCGILGCARKICRHRAPRSHISTGYGYIQEVKNLLKTFWKRHKILLLALVLGLSAFLLSYNALSFYPKTEKVVVTVHDMKPYQKDLQVRFEDD